jgi:hypothetical protein
LELDEFKALFLSTEANAMFSEMLDELRVEESRKPVRD